MDEPKECHCGAVMAKRYSDEAMLSDPPQFSFDWVCGKCGYGEYGGVVSQSEMLGRVDLKDGCTPRGKYDESGVYRVDAPVTANIGMGTDIKITAINTRCPGCGCHIKLTMTPDAEIREGM